MLSLIDRNAMKFDDTCGQLVISDDICHDAVIEM